MHTAYAKRIPIILLLALSFFACTPCSYDGPYKGRLIDAETGKPIEGVVVLGVWHEISPSPGGSVSSYHDAQETVTDKNGNFEVKGLGLQIMSSVGIMNVLIFKSGYEQVGPGSWYSLKHGGLHNNRVSWEGDRATIQLRKLTAEERKTRLFGKENIPDEKQILLIRELNKERLSLGLDPYEGIK